MEGDTDDADGDVLDGAREVVQEWADTVASRVGTWWPFDAVLERLGIDVRVLRLDIDETDDEEQEP